jgi:hypothetical protein
VTKKKKEQRDRDSGARSREKTMDCTYLAAVIDSMADPVTVRLLRPAIPLFPESHISACPVIHAMS